MQDLWTIRQRDFFFNRITKLLPRAGMWMCASRTASLDRRAAVRRIFGFHFRFRHVAVRFVTMVHRYHETIAGRAYHIEVIAVSNRWRAQLARVPGIPTAMMPFYGKTPDEAAQHLIAWLTLAHTRLAGPGARTGPVASP